MKSVKFLSFLGAKRAGRLAMAGAGRIIAIERQEGIARVLAQTRRQVRIGLTSPLTA
jgi:hypothetical protein